MSLFDFVVLAGFACYVCDRWIWRWLGCHPDQLFQTPPPPCQHAKWHRGRDAAGRFVRID